jgi:hypothetical protein
LTSTVRRNWVPSEVAGDFRSQHPNASCPLSAKEKNDEYDDQHQKKQATATIDGCGAFFAAGQFLCDPFVDPID